MAMRVFYSYAHEDERHRQVLEVHFSLLRRQGAVQDWHQHRILAGERRQEQINRHHEEAEMILLLVSPHFMASDYCYEIEARRAMERHAAGTAQVIPLILRPTDWEHAIFGGLQPLPKDGRPISAWPDQDAAWLEVVRGIRAATGVNPAAPGGMNPQAPEQAPEHRSTLGLPFEEAQEGEGVEIFLSSALFGIMMPMMCSLDRPTGVYLDRIVHCLNLPERLHHEGRVGMFFHYRLIHKKRTLIPTRPLNTQGVKPGSMLELEVEVKPFAAVHPVSDGRVFRSDRYQEAAAEDRALGLALLRLRHAAG